MATTTVQTFDNVSISALSFFFKNDEAAIISDCVGKLSGETEMQEIVKKCGATEIKKISKPTKLTVTITAHVPVEVFRRFYGLKHDEALKPGIYSYGPNSVGEKFALSAKILDEFEGNAKLLAFLNAVSTSGLSFEIENGADEVAALELEAGVMIDDLGKFYHEAIVQELEEDLTDSWMNKLTPDVLKIAAAQQAKASLKK